LLPKINLVETPRNPPDHELTGSSDLVAVDQSSVALIREGGDSPSLESDGSLAAFSWLASRAQGAWVHVTRNPSLLVLSHLQKILFHPLESS
jgi:hypothetical protein